MSDTDLRLIFEIVGFVTGAALAIWRIGRWLGMTMAKLTYLTSTVEDGFKDIKGEIKELKRLEDELRVHRERLARLEGFQRITSGS